MGIDDDIRKAEQHLQQLKAKKSKGSDISFIKKLDEYTDAEKIEHFDEIYEFAYSIIESKLNDEWHEDNDDDSYAYETVMKILARDPKTFWEDHSNFFDV